MISEQKIPLEISKLINSRQSLELATVSGDGIPCASYAPFISDDRMQFYVLLSDLAQHTTNIRINPRVSVMVIEDEADTLNLFARNRLVLDCHIAQIDRNSDPFSHWIAIFKERFGPIVDTLRQLSDFNLFVLTPNSGVYVKGFGQAFQVFGESTIEIKHLSGNRIKANDGDG